MFDQGTLKESASLPENDGKEILGLAVSPTGKLYIDADPRFAEALSPVLVMRLKSKFEEGQGFGLFYLGSIETDSFFPPIWRYWRDFAVKFVSALCQSDGLEERREKIDVPFSYETVDQMLAAAPPMQGAEYIRVGLLAELWRDMLLAFRSQISLWKGTVQEFFREKNPVWNLVGKVCFHLAENTKDPESPFAFLASYTTQVNEHARLQHLPLGNALKQYAGAHDKSKLFSLLSPIQAAAGRSEFLKELVSSGGIFQPLAWKPGDAYRFLRDVPFFETSGIVCRVPDWWKNRTAKRPHVRATIGNKPSGGMGLESILDFSVSLVMDGEPITPEEWEAIKTQSDGLVLIRGKWVELDRSKLEEVLGYWKHAQRLSRQGLTFVESMRLLAGAPIGRDVKEVPGEGREWSRVVPGEWLSKILDGLRSPDGLPLIDPGKALHAVLRPYQKVGVQWLWFLYTLGLGACLADDMGLGKTMQVLALLLVLKREKKGKERPEPHCLIVPASVIGNWEQEIRRFAPDLKTFIAHPSALPAQQLKKVSKSGLEGVDLVITSYGSVYRLPWLGDASWDLVVLDEAQAIKNPDTKQTRSIKDLKCRHRLVLTGTPVENRLSDLWSIFDFLNPGLLGSAKQFTDFSKLLAERSEAQYLPLRNLVRPYILRRMKTDRTIIDDLPDKTEMPAFCALSKRQAVLYQENVQTLSRDLEISDGIERKGLILSYLLRFKQICNHPSQWLRDGAFDPADSGKFGRLRELAEAIAAKGEKVLVFTQFREMTDPLSHFLQGVFGRPGLKLDGQTPVKQRKNLVDKFQNDELSPFFVLSVKAGGVGLNLTAANHVIHFDRWWNPAVENQATDRAFRIGQKKNVLVHKFICRGTIEEKIDSLISSKLGMAREILSDGAEAILTTEMSNEELMKLVTLDLSRAMDEG